MCTALIYKDLNGNAYVGRTHEQPELFVEALTYYPKGSKIESSTPAGKQGATFNTRYAFLAVTIKGLIPDTKQDTVLQGHNDQGMSFTTNVLMNTTSAETHVEDSKILAVNDLGHWVLGNFENVAQVKQALESKQVAIWVPPVAVFGNVPAPAHCAIYDKSGAGLVIEILDGQVQVFDNTVGVLTNDPEFTWHLKNMNNYAHLTNVDHSDGQYNNLKVSEYHGGSALSSLPSTQTSVGRFVKAAFCSNYAKKANNPKEAILTLSHVMNNFDRFSNFSVDIDDTSKPGVDSSSSEVTLITFLHDLAQNHFYMRTISAMNYTKFDINKLAVLTDQKVVQFDSIDALYGGDGTHLFIN